MKINKKLLNAFSVITLVTTAGLLAEVYNAPSVSSYNQKFAYLVFSFFAFSGIAVYGLFFKKEKQVRYFIKRQAPKKDEVKNDFTTIEGLVKFLNLSGRYDMALKLNSTLRDFENACFYRTDDQRSLERSYRANLEDSVHAIKAMMASVHEKVEADAIDEKTFLNFNQSIDSLVQRMENLEVETMRLGVQSNVEGQLKSLEDKVESLMKGLNLSKPDLEEILESKVDEVSLMETVEEIISSMSLSGSLESYRLDINVEDMKIKETLVSNNTIKDILTELFTSTNELNGPKKLSIESRGDHLEPKLYFKAQLDDSDIYGAYTTPTEYNSIVAIHNIVGNIIGSQVIIELKEERYSIKSTSLENSDEDIHTNAQAGQLSQ